MKINDIILTERMSPEDGRKLTALQGRGGKASRLAAEMNPFLDAGYDWDVASELARDELDQKRRNKDNKSSQPQPQPQPQAQPQPRQTTRKSSTPDDERTRQDVIGRNLRHDRYYRDKPDLDYTDNMFGDPDQMSKAIDKIPGVKFTKKASKDAKVHFDKGREIGRNLMNFGDKKFSRK